MSHRTDIEIARDAKKRPIQEIGAKLGIPTEHLLPYGHDKAKVGQEFIQSLAGKPDGKLGVRAEGAGPQRVVNVTMNVQATDADSFRRSRRQIMADIKRASGGV